MSSEAEPESRQALADKIRNEHLHGNRRRGVVNKLGLVTAAVILCGAVLWIQLAGAQSTGSAADAPRNATADYGFLADGETETERPPTPVVIYEDFLCSSCSLFHEQTSQYLSEQVAAGAITLEYRPFAFLVNASPNEYSQRAANAAACVGDLGGTGAFVAMHSKLLANQPEHGAAGPNDEQLIEFAKDAGVEDAESCITDRRFDDWVSKALNAAVASGVSVTPTIHVGDLEVVREDNGQESMPGVAELQFAIEKVAAQ